MANHLQRLAALAILAVAASGADFSHRAHLAQGLSCVTCHAAVTKSSRVEDNNLPKAEACLQCHESAPSIKPPRAFPLAKFPHDKHVAALPCATCHKGMDSAEVTSNANFPSMAQCMACHTQSDPPDNCTFCHAKTMNLEPATHGDLWVDAHSRVKRVQAEKATCQMCHGRNFHCAGCH